MWTDPDRVMAMALTAFEASLCSGCGLPTSIAHGDDNVGRWEVDPETICHGCAALESFRESNKDHYPGQKLHLHDSHSEAPTQ